MRATNTKMFWQRALAIVVLVISLLFFLRNGFMLLVEDIFNDDIVLELGDNNRPAIESFWPRGIR